MTYIRTRRARAEPPRPHVLRLRGFASVLSRGLPRSLPNRSRGFSVASKWFLSSVKWSHLRWGLMFLLSATSEEGRNNHHQVVSHCVCVFWTLKANLRVVVFHSSTSRSADSGSCSRKRFHGEKFSPRRWWKETSYRNLHNLLLVDRSAAPVCGERTTIAPTLVSFLVVNDSYQPGLLPVFGMLVIYEGFINLHETQETRFLSVARWQGFATR